MFTPCDAWCKVFTGRSVHSGGVMRDGCHKCSLCAGVHSRWVAEWLTLGAVNTALRVCLWGKKMKNRTLFDFDLRYVHKSMWCVTMYSSVQFTGRCDAWREHMVEMVQYMRLYTTLVHLRSAINVLLFSPSHCAEWKWKLCSSDCNWGIGNANL